MVVAAFSPKVITPKKIGMILVTACICALTGAPPDFGWRACVWRTWYQPVRITSAISDEVRDPAHVMPCGSCVRISLADQLRFMPRNLNAGGAWPLA